MKKALSTFIFANIIIIANAQSPLPASKNQLNIGLGLSGWGIPVYIGIDHSVSRDITLGGELSFRSYKENYRNYDYNHHITGISVNGNYHFNRLLTIPQNFDFYAGLNLGFYIWSSPSDYNGSHTSGLDLNAQIGGRYYFSKNAGINLEFGGGNAFSGGKFGLSFKL